MKYLVISGRLAIDITLDEISSGCGEPLARRTLDDV